MKLAAIVTAALALVATDARAEIVVFTNGRSMSVKSIRLDAGQAVIRLRNGGEVTFPAAIVARVDPDEVPYPEDGNREAGDDGPGAAHREAGTRSPEPGTGIPLEVPDARIPEEMLAARPFAELISSVAAAHNLDKRLVHAVIEQESNYQVRARSKKGAKGLMQLMPGTAAEYGVTNAYDPVQNIKAGVAYLKSLLVRFKNDVSLALAAYNAGPKAVERYGNAVPPYKETRNYVSKIQANAGAAATETGPKPIVRHVEVVNGREVVRYTQK